MKKHRDDIRGKDTHKTRTHGPVPPENGAKVEAQQQHRAPYPQATVPKPQRGLMPPYRKHSSAQRLTITLV